DVSNWGEPDRHGWRERSGIAFSGAFDPAWALVLERAPLHAWTARKRAELAAAAQAVAPSDEAAALYVTLAAGLRSELPDGVEESFARSGLAHVLSVSGLHVAALAFVVLKALRLLLVRLIRSRTLDARRLAAPLSIPLVWAYVAFTGAQAPAVRSALMASVFLGAMAIWRQSDALNNLSLAAIAVIGFDPAAI